MFVLQDQKLFESLALKKQKEKLQTPLFFCCSSEVLPSVYTCISAGVETCLHIQGQVLLVSSSNTYHFLKQKLFQNIQTVQICHFTYSKRFNIQEASFLSLCFPIKTCCNI